MHGEFPYLKFLGGNRLVVGLNERDFVQKPIRSAVLGNMLRAVGVENVAVNRVSIPVVAAGELRQFGFAESLRRHDVPLFVLSDPRGGGDRGNRNSRTEGAA